MKILKSDYRKGYVKVKIEAFEDLWYLSQVVLPGDFVKGLTTRKIESSSKDERSKKIKRQTLVLKIHVSKVEFSPNSTSLRVLGKIAEEKREIPKGSHQNIKVEEGSVLDIEKKEFLNYQIKYLKDASEKKKNNILICAVDQGLATLAILKDIGYSLIGKIEGDVEKKEKRNVKKGDFFKELVKYISDLEKNNKYDRIIIGSPSFWKKYIDEKLSKEIKSKTVFVNCNNSDENGLIEILKRGEMKKVLREERVREEIELVENLLGEIGKEGNYVYGYEDMKKAVSQGAVSKFLVTDSLIKDLMEQNNFSELDKIMKSVEKSRGQIIIVKSNHEGGAKLNGLGGIGGLLRFKI